MNKTKTLERTEVNLEVETKEYQEHQSKSDHLWRGPEKPRRKLTKAMLDKLPKSVRNSGNPQASAESYLRQLFKKEMEEKERSYLKGGLCNRNGIAGGKRENAGGWPD